VCVFVCACIYVFVCVCVRVIVMCVCICVLAMTGRSVCCAPDNLHIFSASGDKTVRMWSIATGDCVRTFQGHSKVVWYV